MYMRMLKWSIKDGEFKKMDNKFCDELKCLREIYVDEINSGNDALTCYISHVVHMIRPLIELYDQMEDTKKKLNDLDAKLENE